MEVNEEIIRYYTNSRVEINRLNTGTSQLEKARTQEIMLPYLSRKPLRILDVGGAAGPYSFWLSEIGYEVHLIDPVPLHIEEARKYSRQSNIPLASINIGESRTLKFENEYFDIVLLFGPLYHLTRREERKAALLEAKRVLRCDGLMFCAGISRFASMLDGFFRGMVTTPGYAEAMKRNLGDGQHRNPEEKPEDFITAYCHSPLELGEEINAVGLKLERTVAIESFGWLLPYFDNKWKQPEYRELLMSIIKLVEKDESLLGMSAHIMAIARKVSEDSSHIG
jgi:ubiquinone/menaquinone biosynthesis C-methylase UbiE